MTPRQMRDLADRLARRIRVTQERNLRAQLGAETTRLLELEEMGINPDALPRCQPHEGSLSY